VAIATTAEKNSLANAYASDAPYGALFTADPGTTGTATGEVSGGSYARQTITWGSASAGVVTGSATFSIPAGVTVTFSATCSSNVAGAATVLDRLAITSQNFASAGQLVVNYSYTQA
jgi:hypothetical protein